MFFALLTAHLVTDFVLQPDWMASAKRQSFWVLALHAAITGLGAMVVAWLYWPQLRGPAIVLAIIHLIVDWTKIRVDARLKQGGLVSFLADQLVHVLSIAGILVAFGLIRWDTPAGFLQALVERRDSRLTYTFVYSISIFFGYVLLKVIMSGLPTSAPMDIKGLGKYVGMLERGLITTCVALGQFLLIAAVIAPRLLLKGLFLQDPVARRRMELEMLVNMALAMGVGLLLR